MLTNKESKKISLMCHFKGTDGIIKFEKQNIIHHGYKPLYKKNLQYQKENTSKISSSSVKTTNDTQNISKEQKELEIVKDPETIKDQYFVRKNDSSVIQNPKIETPVITEQIVESKQSKTQPPIQVERPKSEVFLFEYLNF